MSRHSRRGRAATTDKATASRTDDSFVNFQARLGYGTGNVADGARYAYNPVTRTQQQLEMMYRGSWLVGQAVDCPAEDMTRAGIDITDVDQELAHRMERALVRLGIWTSLTDAERWARLYGGAVAVLLVEGQDLSTPLRMETVGKGQFRGLMVLDRWQLSQTDNKKVTDLGPDLGMPEFYTAQAGGPAKRIHYSRVVRLDGVRLPYQQRLAESGWSMSVIERLYDRLIAFDSATQGAAQLVYKAHLRTIKVEKLREAMTSTGRAFEGVVKHLEMIRRMQTNEGLTVLDSTDDSRTETYTFAGLSDIIMQFGQQVSGALQVPLVRLFGQSPAGFGSGESEIRTYYDGIARQQEERLRPGLHRILGVLHRSLTGQSAPEEMDFSFNPLWQLDDTQKSTIASSIASAVGGALSAGIISRATALRELKSSSDVTGVFGHITDEEIDEAEAEAQTPDLGELGLPPDGILPPDADQQDQEPSTSDVPPDEQLVDGSPAQPAS